MRASPEYALLLVRLGFGLFLLVWGLNKIVNPEHAIRIFERYYGLAGAGEPLSLILGALQIVLGMAILAGLYKTLSYGLGAVLHAASTFATLPHLLLPFAEGSNILFMAGLPVLTAAVRLFLARDADTVLSLDSHVRLGRRASERSCDMLREGKSI